MWNKWFFQNLFYFISRVRSRWNKINVKYNKLKRFLRVFAIINIHEAKLLQCCSQSRPTDDCYVTRIRPAYVLVTSRNATPRFHFLYFISDVRTYTNLKYNKNKRCKNPLFYFILFHVRCADGIIRLSQKNSDTTANYREKIDKNTNYNTNK